MINNYINYRVVKVECALQELPAFAKTLSDQRYTKVIPTFYTTSKAPEPSIDPRNEITFLELAPIDSEAMEIPENPAYSPFIKIAQIQTSQWLLRNLNALNIPAHSYRMNLFKKPDSHFQPPQDFRDYYIP